MELKYMFIPRHWGIGIGAQVCSYRGETIFNHSYSQTFIHDDNNLNYTLNTQFKDCDMYQLLRSRIADFLKTYNKGNLVRQDTPNS